MSDEDSVPPKPKFAKRPRPRPGAMSSSRSRSGFAAASVSAPTGDANGSSASAESGGDDDDYGGSRVVFRTSASGVRDTTQSSNTTKAKPRPNAASSVLSFERDDAASSKALGGVKPLTLPTNLDQASLQASDAEEAASAFSYSARAIADLKATTKSLRSRLSQGRELQADDGNPVLLLDQSSSTEPTVYQTLDTPSFSTTGRHFGADHLDVFEGSIPSQSVIEAAKERRRKAAISASGSLPRESDENLLAFEERKGGSRSVVKPDAQSSRRGDDQAIPTLQQEDDDLGSGDDFGDYTGAQERIQLDAAARRRQDAKVRREQAEQVAGEDGDGFNDQEEEDFERTQLRRMEGFNISRKQEQRREKSPYRPAPLPAISTLPGLCATSHRLIARLTELEESREKHEKIIDDASRALTQLDAEESTNKASVLEWNKKETWASELTAFIESMAALLEEKWPSLEEIEKAFLDLCRERNNLIQQSRAKEMEDELSLFWGVPQQSILPRFQKQQSQAEDMDIDVEEEAGARKALPTQDGDATSLIRSHRRLSAIVPVNQAAAVLRDLALSPEDSAAFKEAVTPIETRLRSLMADVKAPEFTWPNARLEESDRDDGRAVGSSHPASVHSRFLDWRRRYPNEYANAWGSLSLGRVWEFWAMKEVAMWDPFSPSVSASLPKDLESSASLAALQHYAKSSMALSADESTPLGGDEEVVSSMVSTVFVARLIASAQVYDPWSSAQTSRAISLCMQIAEFIPKSGERFQSLVGAFLVQFEEQIDHIAEILAGSPALPPPGFHPLAIPARLAFTTRLLAPAGDLNGNGGLLFNLFRFWKLSLGSSVNQRLIESLTDTLLSRIGWELLRQGAKTGGGRLAASILERKPADLPLQEDLNLRLESLSSSSAV